MIQNSYTQSLFRPKYILKKRYQLKSHYKILKTKLVCFFFLLSEQVKKINVKIEFSPLKYKLKLHKKQSKMFS